MDNYLILTGDSNKSLAEDIGILLDKEIDYCVSSFANTESRVQIKERVNGKDVIIVQTGSCASGKSVNDHFMDTLLIMDACRRSDCNRIYLILALYPYARQDKKTSRSPISARVVGKMISQYDATVLTIDLHSSQAQGFIDRNFHNFYGTQIFTDIIKKEIQSSESPQDEFILVSPDYGGAARVNAYGAALKIPHVSMCKIRDNSKPGKIEKTTIPILDYDLQNRRAFIIDDMADTMGTMVSCCNNLQKNYGIKEVTIIVTHGVFSGPAIDRINKTQIIKKIIVTDTVPQEEHKKLCPKLEVVSVSPLFAKAITIIRDTKSKIGISSLFRVESSSKLSDISEESLFDAIV